MQEQIICPQCHSDQIHANQKGFNNNRAALGMVIGGALPAITFGALDSGKIVITCLRCAHQFEPGQGAIKTTDETGNVTIQQPLPEESGGIPIFLGVLMILGLISLWIYLVFF